MQTPNPTAARAGSEMEQALTKVLNEKSALQAENAALRAALEAIEEATGDLMSDVEGDGLTARQTAEFLAEIQNQARAALAGQGVQS
jgi:regulator of replication initiation timing